MEDFLDDNKTKCVCACLVSVMLALVGLLSFSFGVIEPTEYGILYNKITKQIDTDTDNIYENGLSFIGPHKSFVKFPRTHKVIEFSDYKGAQQTSLKTRTKEGLELKLHVAFQYKLIKNELPQLYSLAGTDYDSVYTKIATNVILQKAAEYTAPQYWQNRTLIGNEMEAYLDTALQQAYANCTGLMLLKIDLPDTYESAIEDTQVVIQEKATQEKVKNATLIRKQIEVERSNADMQIQIINAQAEAQALIERNNAQAQIIQNTVSMQSTAYAQAQQSIATASSTELLDYIFYLNIMALEKNGRSKLLVDVDDATINLAGSSGKGYGF